MDDSQERELLLRLPKNPNAFEPLYAHYFPRVFAYVAYHVGSRQEAEDLTADIFLKVIEAIHRFEYRGAGSFAAWVFRIAHNVVQQFYRISQRRDALPLDDLPEIRSSGLLPDEMVVRKERFAHLQSALALLTPRQREVITLRYFGELRNQEIAAVLNLDERTVATHLSRGLDDLKLKYQEKEVLYD